MRVDKYSFYDQDFLNKRYNCQNDSEKSLVNIRVFYGFWLASGVESTLLFDFVHSKFHASHKFYMERLRCDV